MATRGKELRCNAAKMESKGARGAPLNEKPAQTTTQHSDQQTALVSSAALRHTGTDGQTRRSTDWGPGTSLQLAEGRRHREGSALFNSWQVPKTASRSTSWLRSRSDGRDLSNGISIIRICSSRLTKSGRCGEWRRAVSTVLLRLQRGCGVQLPHAPAVSSGRPRLVCSRIARGGARRRDRRRRCCQVHRYRGLAGESWMGMPPPPHLRQRGQRVP